MNCCDKCSKWFENGGYNPKIWKECADNKCQCHANINCCKKCLVTAETTDQEGDEVRPVNPPYCWNTSCLCHTKESNTDEWDKPEELSDIEKAIIHLSRIVSMSQVTPDTVSMASFMLEDYRKQKESDYIRSLQEKIAYWQDKCESSLQQERDRLVKAFGGCEKCYGKGYSTQMVNEVGAEDFGGEGYETGPHTRMNFCSCERGKQLYALIKGTNK